MTHTLTLAGDVSSALTHFALAGVSQLARSLSSDPVTLRWTEEATPRAQLESSQVTGEEIAAALIRTARSWAQGWTAVRHTYGEGTFSPFSPRFKAIKADKYPDDWAEHQNARLTMIDQLTVEGDDLSLRFIHALGEAAYWRFDRNDPRPDHGASRWEMKTRNRGEEFVSDRLHSMCAELATWDKATVLSGLAGATVNDTLAKNPLSSRTATGFTPPGPTDVALAFAALLGVTQFPLTHRTHALSVTPGAYPHNVLHPKVLVLPVNNVPLTSERHGNIIVSAPWARITAELGAQAKDKEVDPLNFVDDHAALKARGVPAAAVFRIHRGGSPSAPERYIETGQVQLL